MRNSSTSAAATILTLAIGLVGPAGVVRAASPEPATFVIEQDVPVLSSIAVGPSASPGDLLAFEARITVGDGREGMLRGLLITVDVPDESGDLLEDRVGQLVFDLGDGDSLVVAGASVYESEADEMTPGAPQVRAVVGGTGRYIGARGEVETIRNPDGTYEHEVTLIDQG